MWEQQWLSVAARNEKHLFNAYSAPQERQAIINSQKVCCHLNACVGCATIYEKCQRFLTWLKSLVFVPGKALEGLGNESSLQSCRFFYGWVSVEQGLLKVKCAELVDFFSPRQWQISRILSCKWFPKAWSGTAVERKGISLQDAKEETFYIQEFILS